ncbi:MAG: monofunctional biosynthetic peptidoglycan transglycosylase [Proteobacteria bacterium]|nr:monofunctional biosynthetic peptidoglycan transglycosylase [Pseudomonadota bacterium]
MSGVRRVVVLFAWVILAAIIALHAYYAVMIWWWRVHPPRETAFMAERLAVLRVRDPHAAIRYRFVPYARISVELKRAMVAAEDAKFVEHEGFDWNGIALALEKNEKRGRIVAGGSTISQQLARNLFLSGSRTWLRKGEEAVITVMLETILDKRRILELYLNVIEWGSGIFGAEAASEHYFHVPAARIDAAEAARLAAMAPNPRYYERHPNAPGLRRKIGIILARMPSADLP